MDFNDYQKKSRETAIYPNAGKDWVYPTLGLAGEAGEIANKMKKVIRDKNGKVDEETRESIKGELGDTLWYVSQVATELNLSLDEIAEKNIEKLFSRKERGVIKGSGDSR
ncbi:MAG: nucleoside triphosphate pyrophosphohydrolase family protein [bacterium]|nr:nucleoside triphosphate pyrophosphohydrolase family protein [bacterium]